MLRFEERLIAGTSTILNTLVKLLFLGSRGKIAQEFIHKRYLTLRELIL